MKNALAPAAGAFFLCRNGREGARRGEVSAASPAGCAFSPSTEGHESCGAAESYTGPAARGSTSQQAESFAARAQGLAPGCESQPSGSRRSNMMAVTPAGG